MKRAGTLLVVIILFLTYLIPNCMASEQRTSYEIISAGQYEKGYRYNIQGWTYIHIEGEPYQRGYQYGYLASAEITNMLYRWADTGHGINFKRNLPNDYDKVSQAWWNTCKEKSMKHFEKHIPEEYRQEMQGIVDGLNDRGAELFGNSITYEDIVASQFVQDVWYAFYFTWSHKKIHPIRSLVYGLRDLITGKIDFSEIGHCNAFIATGDATENGEIVVAHATMFQKDISQRVNFIVDIKPNQGNRFVMSSPPGAIWSMEDFYYNDKGIVLTETELVPQGPFNVRKTPKGVRSRTAIQYSSTIDEVINYLQKGNNGLIPNEWLIGDTKTGEIARLEQAYFHTPITKKSDGYFISCKAPHNKKVEREIWGLMPKFIAKKYFPTKYNNPVIEKFELLAEQYKGEINEEIAKTIIMTHPISDKATDCKITSTNLLNDNMGGHFYLGNLDETIFDPKDPKFENFKEITITPPIGWLEIYNIEDIGSKIDIKEKEVFVGKNSKVIWDFEIDENSNFNYSDLVISDEKIFSIKDNKIYSFNKKNGNKYFDCEITKDSKGAISPDNGLIIATDLGLISIDKENGEVIWGNYLGEVVSKPVIYKNRVIASFSNAGIFAFDIDTGGKIWSYKTDEKAYISEVINDKIFFCLKESCYGFDLEKESIIWQSKTNGKITTSPKVNQNSVYVSSWDGNLYSLDSSNGDRNWKYQTGWGIVTTPEISRNTLFVGSLDNNFYALEKNTGELKWYYSCNSAIQSNPISYGELIFFGCDDGTFYALDKEDGGPSWRFKPGYHIDYDEVNNYITTPILSDPVADEGIIYFSAKGHIYALDAQTIEKVKENKIEDSIFDLNFQNIILIIFVILLVSFIVVKLFYKKKDKK